MPKKKAKILLIDDNPLGRSEISRLIGDDLGYLVRSPDSISEVREAITFEVFDSLLIDVDLSKFDDIGSKIDGKTIEDGVDVADFYSDLHEVTSGRLYSSHLKLPGSTFRPKIKKRNEKIGKSPFPFTSLPKPLPPDMEQIQEIFQPVLEEAEYVYHTNPFLRPLTDYDEQHLAKRLRAYKSALNLHSSWLDFNFQSVGDRSWAVICGRSVDRRYYGKPLTSDCSDTEFEIGTSDKYPTKEELFNIATEKDAFPFIVWNTRKLEFVEKQFQKAGPRLGNIPDYLRDYFGFSMVSACMKAYEDGMAPSVIDWCKQLTIAAQIEIAKQIFKKIYGSADIQPFLESWKAADLPFVIEVYEARVDAIEKKGDHEQVAWVELRNLNDYRATSIEAFDLRKLRDNDVDHQSQKFEYTVYRLPNDDVGMNIESVEPVT